MAVAQLQKLGITRDQIEQYIQAMLTGQNPGQVGQGGAGQGGGQGY